jgi:hypothetical protein
MEHFSDAVRAANPKDHGFDAAEAELADLIGHRVDLFDGLEWSPVSKIPAKFYAFLQIGLRRTIELSESCIREMNRGNASSMCVLSRGALETAALVYDTLHRVRASVEHPAKVSVEDVDEHLVTVFMGGKSGEWRVKEEYQAKNIITILDRLMKAMPDSHMRWFYDGLSEHAHPNYHGMYAIYVNDVAEAPASVAIFQDRSAARTPLVSSLALSGISLAMTMMDQAMIDEKALRVPFARLCEKLSFDRGTWPEGVEYPVRREEVG